MKFWPTAIYTLYTKRSKDDILRALSIYTVPGEPVIKRGIKSRNKKFIGIVNADGFEIIPIAPSRNIMYFKGEIAARGDQTEVTIHTKLYPVTIVMFIAFEFILAAIFTVLLTCHPPLSFGHFVPLLLILVECIIIFVGFNVELKVFKNRFKQVFFDLF